jgi:hypothetical protein
LAIEIDQQAIGDLPVLVSDDQIIQYLSSDRLEEQAASLNAWQRDHWNDRPDLSMRHTGNSTTENQNIILTESLPTEVVFIPYNQGADEGNSTASVPEFALASDNYGSPEYPTPEGGDDSLSILDTSLREGLDFMTAWLREN